MFVSLLGFLMITMLEINDMNRCGEKYLKVIYTKIIYIHTHTYNCVELMKYNIFCLSVDMKENI